MRTIYFDNNATTKVAEQVLEEMVPLFCELYGNPSSMHTFGGQIGRRIAWAREQVAGLLGCEPSEIIFTSGGTESDNAAIKGTLAALPHSVDGLPRAGKSRLYGCGDGSG
jgi:cysteine desulfurase